ncbi:hypothetical protein ACFRMQ_06860 [Kitasatospora sp. NPDC056783]|uniref:hypothetical protein n=1 Tax=Kitasatospora sp. NPDC056783 TaxID=3345943 RepID=UPI0036CC2492
MHVQSRRGGVLRRALIKAAVIGTAVTAALSLTATEAGATGDLTDVSAASFTLNQTDWFPGYGSTDNGYTLSFQYDGNLVLYNGSGTPLWASGTNNRGVTRLVWSYLGYVALKDGNGNNVCTLGSLNRAPNGDARLQDDGNFVFYKANGGPASWATNTNGGQQGNRNYCFG